MNNNHKLAIIVPYRDRQKQLDVFIPHMKKFLSRPAQLEWYVGNLSKESYGEDRLRSSSSGIDTYLDYDIFVVEQSDEYPFNRGMLINSCVKILPPEYDYFVFQDIDLLPMIDSIRYAYEEHPLHMATHFEGNIKLPYFEYIGGCLKITRENFEKINGFSNEYWGWGLEDLDLLARMRNNNLLESQTYYDNSNLFENNRYNYVDVSPSKFKMKREFMAFKFDGKSYIRILNNDRISDITHGSFSMSAWFKPEFDPKINKCNKKNPISILSRAGFHTGIQIIEIQKKYVLVRCMGFTEDNNEIYNDNFSQEFKVPMNKWSQVCFIVDDKKKEIQVYLNGVLMDGKNQKITYKNDLKFYDTSYFIGSSYENTGNFIGWISEPCWFDYSLTKQEVKLLYDKNPSEHSWTHFYDEPCLYFPFNQVYNNFVFDSSFNRSHGVIHNFDNNTELVKEFEISLGVEIEVPNRLNGKFKCLTKDKINNIKRNMKLASIDYFEDLDLKENYEFYHELVKEFKVMSTEDGLSNVSFKLLGEKKYKNAKWIQLAF